MSHQQLGLLFLLAGAALAGLGLLAWAGGLSWFGHLPGDVRVESGSTRVYIPITSMLLLSAALSALLWLARRLL